MRLADTVATFISKAKLLDPGDRLGLAISGGADSVALLRLMLELQQQLGIVLSVIHFNHKLRGKDAEDDEAFVAELSRKHGLEFFCGSGDVAAYSKGKHLSTEAASKSLRYAFFSEVMANARLTKVATAHTLDDQAETVLLKMTRGAGTRGLAGIYPKLVVHQGKVIVRPLLGVSRRDIEAYLQGLGQSWREDESNRDLRHSRNVVRHGILPRLERKLNPRVRHALAETAEIARADEEYWGDKVAQVLPQLSTAGSGIATLHILERVLAAQPLALQRRLLRAHAESLGLNLEFKDVERILQMLPAPQLRRSVILSGGWVAKRTADGIHFEPRSSTTFSSYAYKLSIPGKVVIPEVGISIEAALHEYSAESAYNLDGTLDGAMLERELRVRNWLPGDRFWPAHTKCPKKVKELLQRRRIVGIDRKLVPVVVSGTEVIWLSGFPVPEKYRPRTDAHQQVVIIRETTAE